MNEIIKYYSCDDCEYIMREDKRHKRSHGGYDCLKCGGEVQECHKADYEKVLSLWRDLNQ